MKLLSACGELLKNNFTDCQKVKKKMYLHHSVRCCVKQKTLLLSAYLVVFL